jgi:ADP-ribose pyrophosphatase YjhB (NUDIX family)
MYPTDLTVAAVVLYEGRYLIVEELAHRRAVLTQPGGHIESGESPEAAVVREVKEETGCTVLCEDLIGVYLWIQPQTRQQFLRLVYSADFVDCDEDAALDEGVIARRWLTLEELQKARSNLRTPVVLRCVHDFEAGIRQSDSVLTGMLPLNRNVAAVLAAADLV